VRGATHRVVGRQLHGLVGRKVREVRPVPGGDQHVLSFQVAVAHPRRVRSRQALQQLVCDPQLRMQGPDSGKPRECCRCISVTLHVWCRQALQQLVHHLQRRRGQQTVRSC
jgi:hypothetical protein